MIRPVYLPEPDAHGRHNKVAREDTEARLRQRGVEFITVEGQPSTGSAEIKTGVVLDAHAASVWSLTQTAELAELLQSGIVGADDVIFIEDQLTLGYPALPLVLHHMPPDKRPKVFVRCLAGSTDDHDFTFPMRRWMRHFEHVVDETVDGVLVACDELAAHLRVGGLNTAPIYVTGLPFDMHRVRRSVPAVKPLSERSKRVTYASRLDEEKQPHFALKVWERLRFLMPGAELVIASGFKELRSNDPSVIDRLRGLEARGLVTIRTGLEREEYYALLADSRVLLITSLQDWVSNVAMEASALGTAILAPAYRSFPAVLNNDRRHLFVPWSVEDAVEKLIMLLNADDVPNLDHVARSQHESLDKTIDVLLGQGDRWLYRGPRREPAWDGTEGCGDAQ